MAEMWVEFSAGRRGAGSIDCLFCGTPIHQRPNEVPGAWYDGSGHSGEVIAPLGLPGTSRQPHQHEPAKEVGPRLGPFDNYVQITYDTIRYESEIIAYYDEGRGGDWVIVEPWAGAGEAYSDITIFMEEAS